MVMMKLEQPGSLTEAVYRAMRADLLACRTPPGEKLRIAVLCQRHGASSGAVREALSRLSAEGLVTLEPQRGFQAATISADELCDLTFARVEVECLCLRLAIEHGEPTWEERLLSSANRLRSSSMRAPSATDVFRYHWPIRHVISSASIEV